jgi:putative tryptophan/tyrosine transport system substrate-binding protein
MRRQFIVGLGAASAWPVAVRGQGERVRRIGLFFASTEDDLHARARSGAFLEGLRKLGWNEGHNLHVDSRWVGVDPGRISSYAAELLTAEPEVLFANSVPTLAALQHATHSIPIVFAQIIDPIANGFVTSLARPGGNITGFALFEQGVAVKRLELLKEIAPSVSRVAFMYDPINDAFTRVLAELEGAAPTLGVQIVGAAVRRTDEIVRFLEEFAREPRGGLVCQALPSALTDN